MKTMLCHVCGDVADNTCRMCGRPACDAHFDKRSGMCTKCRAGRSFK